MEEFAVGLRREEQDVADLPALYKSLGEAKPVHVPGTAEIEIEGSGTGRKPQAPLKHAGSRGQEVVRALGTHQKEIDVRGRTRSRLKELIRGRNRQVRRAFLFGADSPLGDSGLGADLLRRPFGKLRGQVCI